MSRKKSIKKLFIEIFLISFFLLTYFTGCKSKKQRLPQNIRNQTATTTHVFHHKGVLSIYPVDQHKLLSVGRDSLIILWNADSGKAILSKRMPRMPEKIGYDQKRNTWWIACKGGVFYRIDLKNLSIQKTFTSILHDILQFKYDPPSMSFLGVGTNELFQFKPEQGQIRILATATSGAAFAGHPTKPLWAVFEGKRITIERAGTMKAIKSFTLPKYKAGKDKERLLAFLGGQGLVVSYGENLWLGNWQTGVMRLMPKNHHAPITTLTVSDEDSLVATGSMDKSIKLWNWPKGDLQGSLYGHFLTITSLSFADSGRKLISGSEDGSLIIWNMKTKLLEKRLGSLKIAMKNPWQLTVKRVRYARSFKVGSEEYNVSDTKKTRLIKVTAEIKNTGLADNMFFSSNLYLTAPDQTRFHCVGLENYVALAPKAYFKRRIAPGKSLKGNFIFIIEPPYKKYTITYETLKPIPLKNY